MIPRLESLASTFSTTDMLIPMVLGDIDDAKACERSRGGAGPSIAWQVGHMLAYRHMALAALGAGGENPYDERFAKNGATDGAFYPTVAEFLSEWESTRGKLAAAMESATEEAMTTAIDQRVPHGVKRPIDSLAFFAFHEGYHMGALGQHRKEMGLPGPAELVMAKMAAG